ncbi:MAG TPA: N-6 DNA methylase [Terriglobales bacterium]|nr:N-6 DNA methylase [Terriglobales bacterium]
MSEPNVGEFLAAIETVREELADELFRRKHGSGAGQRLDGQSIDRALIWFLFTRVCEQRNVSHSSSAIGSGVKCESATPAESLERLWEKIAALFSSLPAAEALGTVYEAFLRTPITFTRNGPRFHATSAVRKSGGVFYTPGYIVDYIVEETVGKVIAGKSPQEMSRLRVLDPACGAGRFLLRVYERILQEHVRWFAAHPEKTDRQVTRDADGVARLSYPSKCGILKDCIFGVDVDELAVEVAQLSLYLKLTEEQTPAMALDNSVWGNVRAGNSLGMSGQESPGSLPGDFDVVLGNPPYGAELSAAMRRDLAKQFQAGTTETAALMMLRASRSLTRQGGVNGFIVPKAFAYSSNWGKVRNELLNEMTSLIDAGKVWPEVKLEQVIYFLRKGAASTTYANLKRDGVRFWKVAMVEKQHCRDFGFLLNGITREELAVGLKIRGAGGILSDHLTNARGAMFQDQVSEIRKDRRVIGGKQVQRFRVFGEKGFVSSRATLDKNAFVTPGSILVQNIIAHIEKPVDHVKITAAVADEELARDIVILDTVNQLTNGSRLSSYFFLAILNSRLMNWYAYRFVFAKAIRTMHFDGPVTSRIPIPRITAENAELYQKIVRAATTLSRTESAECAESIDSALHDLYGLSVTEVEVIERAMPSGKEFKVNAYGARR